MPTYEQVLEHVKKNVLWKDEHLAQYPQRVAERVRESLAEIYKANDTGIVVSTGYFCWRMTVNPSILYFDSCYKTGITDNALLCRNMAMLQIELACEHFDIRGDRAYSMKFSQLGERWLSLFACNQFDLIAHCYPIIKREFVNGVHQKRLPAGGYPQRLGILAMEMIARDCGETLDWDILQTPVDPVYLSFCRDTLTSTDDKKVRAGLIELCNKHLEWLDFQNNDERCNLTGYEISRAELLLWPFEYQAIKNWRARHGLSTPKIKHPLMTSPMACEHNPDYSQWERPEWFDPLLSFIAERRPEFKFLPTLF